ncbi:hypothetical protein NP233_g5605 [Leucocoprinus birnbaumii]|uniref:CID domain-containing protein n=1 Tax=Leucocoprinus birnbaumii TaxID=56174 RepID=A0AAD5VSX7_9AGAR|nr:hypothetical protein NP233_g5605 [Leucocoprinus birnbaumii]
MSLYSQSYYGQPSYGGPTYAAPTAQSGYQYQYPQQPPQHPPPHVFIDPATFRRDYSSRLDQLQFNSRPVIQSLSFYAQEYSRYGDIVAQCIDSHIRKVPPWMKLPAFYLLDAISKNVYDPYSRVFAPLVIPLFLETYRSVDDSTRSKMDEMLLTWRTGAPNGKELFGLAPQMAIERGIWGDQAGPNQITKAQVMSELNFALQAKERAIQQNPNDMTSRNHLQVLFQLRGLVEAGVSQDELGQILSQLRNLSRPPPGQAAPPLPPPPQNQWQAPQFTPPAATAYPPPTTQYQAPYSAPSPAPVKSEPAAPALTAPETPAQPDSHIHISSILSSLLKSGLVSAPATENTEAKMDTMEQEPEEEAKPVVPSTEDLTAIKDAQTDYRKRILAERMETSLVENSIDDPTNVSDFLYDYLALQCQQCGIRYPDTTIGKKRLEDHLDLHFRQNRKLSQNVGRGHDRSWFTSVEDWVNEPLGDTPNKVRTPRVKSARVKAAATVERMEKNVDLESQYVTVPPGDEAKPLACPICKETLRIEFLEDEEEWIWRNAVKKDDRVYHATCHAEATSSASNLVTRLKSELGAGSRASTPESTSLRATPPVCTFGMAHLSTKAQLQLLDDVANRDIEMQPAVADAIFLVVDTNILLDHLRILRSFVEDIAFAKVPITVICPGIVLHELDRQKTESDTLGRRARKATDWMLREVTRKDLLQPIVKGQAHRETCRSTKSWKVKDRGEAWSDNDDHIIDCCKYFESKAATLLYTCDKNLCLRCSQEGLRFISPPPPHEYTSLDLVKCILGILPEYGVYLNRMVRNYDRVVRSNIQQGDGMMIDDETQFSYQIPQATLVHQQVIERFTPLLRALVKRVGGAELEKLKNSGNSVSKYAPKWQQNTAAVEDYSVGDCLEYLQYKKRIVFAKPEPPLDRFLRDPYSGNGALSGVEWTASAWKAAVASLRQIGETWKDEAILEQVELLDQYQIATKMCTPYVDKAPKSLATCLGQWTPLDVYLGHSWHVVKGGLVQRTGRGRNNAPVVMRKGTAAAAMAGCRNSGGRDTKLATENWDWGWLSSRRSSDLIAFPSLLLSPMARRRALHIFLSLLALVLVGTVVVLSSITYYLAIDPDAYLSELEVPILDNKTRWDPAEHHRYQYVPKIIHQTWKTETLPTRWQNVSQGCRDMMPDYEYMLWTDAGSREFIAEEYPWFLETFDGYKYNIQRADVIRYFVLHHYGGVYIDLDIGCLRPVDPLLAYPVTLPKTIPVGVSNDLMFSAKGHPFMEQTIHNLVTFDHSWVLNYPTVMFSTGPMFLSAQYGIYASAHPTTASSE